MSIIYTPAQLDQTEMEELLENILHEAAQVVRDYGITDKFTTVLAGHHLHTGRSQINTKTSNITCDPRTPSLNIKPRPIYQAPSYLEKAVAQSIRHIVHKFHDATVMVDADEDAALIQIEVYPAEQLPALTESHKQTRM